MQRSRTNRSSYSSTLATRSADGSGEVALTSTRRFGWAPGNTNAFSEAGGMAFLAR